MTVSTATLSLNQRGLRGPIEMEVGRVDDPASPSAQILTPLAVAFSTLVGEHEPVPLGEKETADAFKASLSFSYDDDRDMVNLSAEFDPPIEQYENLHDMPDSYQMMQLIVMQFLEGVGALNEDGDVAEHAIEAPQPRTLN